MQVNSLGLGALKVPAIGASGQQSGASPIDQVLATLSGADSSSTSSTATAREILSHYDITNISPRDFSQLLSDLHTSGTISDAELQDLASIRTELDNQGISPDESVNLLDIFQGKLKQQIETGQNAATGQAESMQTADDQKQSVALTQRQITWLQKFSTLHEEASSESVDTLA